MSFIDDATFLRKSGLHQILGPLSLCLNCCHFTAHTTISKWLFCALKSTKEKHTFSTLCWNLKQFKYCFILPPFLSIFAEFDAENWLFCANFGPFLAWFFASNSAKLESRKYEVEKVLVCLMFYQSGFVCSKTFDHVVAPAERFYSHHVLSLVTMVPNIPH